jgi:hypothetical protein
LDVAPRLCGGIPEVQAKVVANLCIRLTESTSQQTISTFALDRNSRSWLPSYNTDSDKGGYGWPRGATK